MSDFAPSPEPNVPDYSEDANSPFSVSGAASHTLTLSDTHSEMLARLTVTPANATNRTVEMTVPNGSYYAYDLDDGSGSSSASSVVLGDTTNGNHTITGWLHLTSAGGSMYIAGPLRSGYGRGYAPALRSGAWDTGSIGEVTIAEQGGLNIAVDMEVFHR